MSQTNTTQIEQQLDVFIDSSFASHLRNEKEAKERKIQEGLDALDAQIGGEITQPFLQKAEHFLNNLESSAYGFAESILEAPEPGLAFLVDEYIQEHPEIDGALFRSKFKERQRQSYFLEKYFVFGKWLTAKVAEELRETQKNIESKVRRTVDAYMEKLVRYEFECLLESHSTSETLLELQDKVAELRNSPADDAELRAELSQCLDGYADTYKNEIVHSVLEKLERAGLTVQDVIVRIMQKDETIEAKMVEKCNKDIEPLRNEFYTELVPDVEARLERNVHRNEGRKI